MTTTTTTRVEVDFIVVGGGSAGAVIATRLTEDPELELLLLECGPNDKAVGLNVRAPAACGKLQFSNASFAYFTEPQTHAALALNKQQVHLPQGRTLGGGSSINYMAYVRGAAADFDEWEALGAEGWAYKDVLPYFKKSEGCLCIGDPNIVFDCHGRDGPLAVSFREPRNPIATSFVNACVEAGYKAGDYNAGKMIGVASYFQTTTMIGERASTAFSYLHPAMKTRKNLRVVTDAQVIRLLYSDDKTKVIGVEYNFRGQVIQCFARKEVIVSAGTINTPKLLQLSGIGPKETLQSHNVPVVKDLPVGLGLQDHITTLLICVGPPGKDIGCVNLAKAEGFPGALKALGSWLNDGTGILASSTYDAHLLLNTDIRPEQAYPDIQIGVLCAAGDPNLIYKNLNMDPKWKVTPEYLKSNAEGFGLIVTLLNPTSRGYVAIKDSNPSSDPIIQPNYLKEELDMKLLRAGCKKAMELLDKPALKDIVGQVWFPEEILAKHNNELNDDFWEEYVRHFSTTLYHPTSTCSIGKVVDPQLKVFGLEGLRVADASVMPKITSGNTNAPSIMIGEKAADLIATQYGYTNKSQKTASARERMNKALRDIIKRHYRRFPLHEYFGIPNKRQARPSTSVIVDVSSIS